MRADGLHFGVRLDQDRVCTLVIVGVGADGKKELVASSTGTASPPSRGRAAAGRQAARHARAGAGGRRRRAGILGRAGRGVPRDPARPLLAAQGGQRAGLPAQVAQPAARKAVAEIRDAEDRQHAEKAITDFAAAYKAKNPKAIAKITDYQEQLLAFYDFPAEQWVHLKTSNPIESTFATVRLRTKVSKDPAAGRPGWRWCSRSSKPRYVNGPHLVALVRAGAKLEKGVLIERPDEAEIKVAA